MDTSFSPQKVLISTVVIFLAFAEAFSQDVKPQTPVAPFPYTVEEVVFKNADAEDIQLAGTLFLPEKSKKAPVAIIISGSGPQNRNGTLLGHEYYLVLADHLVRQGIAVLRYDERGVAESEGEFKGSTSADFSTDVEAAISYLNTRKDINKKKIGLIGHSEGGLIAPMVASRNTDVAYVVMMAGPGLDGGRVLSTQVEKSTALQGANPEVAKLNADFIAIIAHKIRQKNDTLGLDKEIKSAWKQKRDSLSSFLQQAYNMDLLSAQMSFHKDPWMYEFFRLDPQEYLKKITVPVLAINGSLDVQVIAEVNLPQIKNALASSPSKDVTVKELEGLNHLFQEATTGSALEYAQIKQTISPSVLELIAAWINERF
ncbi:hypothetical protein GCM10009117_24710 [Gangjinia marincola]|uniref:Serine aminopeptidase S33 domain-containing protein n=1 Tax=Gangjinia marincola TaxID=578463 RepID=A0ABP3XZM9_9FLAO